MEPSLKDYMLREMKFDPFATVRFEGNVKPDSRTKVTSLLEKIVDTFQVFDGGSSVLQPRDEWEKHASLLKPPQLDIRPGIFDYLTLGIFRSAHTIWYVSGFALYEAFKKATTSTGLKKFGFGALSALLAFALCVTSVIHFVGNGIIRHALSFAATVCMLPIIALSHVIAKTVSLIESQKLFHQLNELNTEKESSQTAGILKKLRWTQISDLNIVLVQNSNIVYIKQNNPNKELTNSGKAKLQTLFKVDLPPSSPLRLKLIELNKDARLQAGHKTNPRFRKF